jgi:hypothetical protein
MEKKQFGHLPTIRFIGRSAFHKHLRKLGVTNAIVCRFWYDEEDTSNIAR